MQRIALLFTDFGVHTAGVVIDVSAVVHSVRCQNKNAAIRYLQLFDSRVAPTAGAVPTLIIPIPITSTVQLGSDFFSQVGLLFKKGVAWGFSTTETTYTAGSAADQLTQIVHSRW